MPIHSVTCAVILCCTLISDSHIKPVTPPHAQNWCSALWTVAVSTVLWRVLGPSQLSTLALSYDFITQQQAVVSVSVSTEQKKIHNKSMSNQVRLKECQNEKTMSLFLSGQWMYVHKAALLWKEFAFFYSICKTKHHMHCFSWSLTPSCAGSASVTSAVTLLILSLWD